MSLLVNLLRTVTSIKFICCCWRNPRCDYYVTHTPKCNEPAEIRENYCGLTILIVSLFSLCCLRITKQLRPGTVDKMAGIFTKRIWQPCLLLYSTLYRQNLWMFIIAIQIYYEQTDAFLIHTTPDSAW